MPFWKVLKELMSRFINEDCYLNKSLILDRELSFLPIYSEFVEQVSVKDPSVRNVLRRLPRFLKALRDVKVKRIHLRYVGVLRNTVKPTKGMKILDVGCQFGTNLLELKNLGVDVYGVDLMVPYISVLKKRCKCLGVEIHAVVADAAMLPFSDGCFDVVMSREFVSHVADLDRALCEMFRVTREKIILEDTNMMSPNGFFALFTRGGLRWLFTKGKVHNFRLYRGKWEDVHSTFWWKRKLSSFANKLKVVSSVPFVDSLIGRFLDFLYRYFGGETLLIAYKR
jgi:ubiquinone/menaquinone biosynthesis C-methylase UbiE